MIGTVRVTRLLLVSEVREADEVSEARLVGEIDDALDEVSGVDYCELGEVCEVGQADE